MSIELQEGLSLFKELVCCYEGISEQELNAYINNDINKLYELTKNITKPDKCNIEACKEILKKLKAVIIHIPSIDPLLPIHKKNINDLLLIREILEKGVIISIIDDDIKSFTIYITQLFTYYFDYKNILTKSEKQNALVGVYLLYLLSSNMIGEFHMLLEIIPIEDQNDYFIKYVLELEEHIIDGYFHYVLIKKEDTPLYLYSIFMERLYSTIKYKLADSIFASSNSINLINICEILQLNDENELYNFIAEYNEVKTIQGNSIITYKVIDNKICFNNPNENFKSVPSLEIMNNTIGYATELERIV
ncbi:26S proteasome regulatory subunit RPN12, putative [Hepatocystis sp. ex Piliocolobus tephrosceles]|nr:26S proteasome regulatory subunit RPN12, putative [Hepatocystis sp. ex Piliocolobus tephrosceles]